MNLTINSDSLHNINLLVYAMEEYLFFCEAETEFLYIICINFKLQKGNRKN
jgi:hypothetical protein